MCGGVCRRASIIECYLYIFFVQSDEILVCARGANANEHSIVSLILRREFDGGGDEQNGIALVVLVLAECESWLRFTDYAGDFRRDLLAHFKVLERGGSEIRSSAKYSALRVSHIGVDRSVSVLRAWT